MRIEDVAAGIAEQVASLAERQEARLADLAAEQRTASTGSSAPHAGALATVALAPAGADRFLADASQTQGD